MKEKIMYIADDGAQFDSRDFCLEYENALLKKEKIRQIFITNGCDKRPTDESIEFLVRHKKLFIEALSD